MRELILLLLLLLSSCLGNQAPGAEMPPFPPSTSVPAAPLRRELLVVEDVEAFVLETYPMQLRLAVRGYWPSGCSGEIRVEQQLANNTLTVTIWRAVPAGAACLAVIVPYDETIAIEGSFTQLPAAIAVNGYLMQPRW